MVLAFGSSLGCICLLILGFGFLLWWRHKHSKQIFLDVNGNTKAVPCKASVPLSNARTIFFSRTTSRRVVPRQLKKVPIQRASSCNTQLQQQIHPWKRWVWQCLQRLPPRWNSGSSEEAQRWQQLRRGDSVSDRGGDDQPCCAQTPASTLRLLHNSNRETLGLSLHV